MKHTHLTVSGMIILALGLVGCSSPNPYGDAYGAADTRTIQEVYYGTVIKAEPVTIDANDSSNVIGTIAGAAIGGILGSKIGGGSGSDIAAIGGGLLGGYAGSEAAGELGKRNGVNLTIRLEDGRVISIVQEANPDMLFRVGERVQVNVDGNTARVVLA
ncbi:glycine zipper 2TM domain-containing protein [Enterovibrio paralichthyis]|uniref:glycine zipper 2TM domain-containing protein n=1 Tax=Enterovibrio paralichthyis TaxID=2853805 RepID=UPI001C4490D3|nr:glycine zipper 2TM domain-containing protein [Enterovibrio paralichthyis]MBV7300819.1 glycine zipper 2TM domain-containing protein [Enterovibrio paralichthyis]